MVYINRQLGRLQSHIGDKPLGMPVMCHLD